MIGINPNVNVFRGSKVTLNYLLKAKKQELEDKLITIESVVL